VETEFLLPPEWSPAVGLMWHEAGVRLALAGFALLASTVTWTNLVGATSGGSTVPFTVLMLGSSIALLIGRLGASVRPNLVPAVVVGGAALLAATTPDLLSGAALGGPLGYANANGAFFTQAAIAGLMLATASHATPARVLGLLACAAFVVVPFAAKSVTSALLLLSLPVIALSVRTFAGARVAVGSCAALFILTLAATIVLGSTYAAGNRSSLVDRVVDATIDERRAVLWHEALVMIREYPATGVGVGGFQMLSPTARSDRDARWAHNSFLQQGAETGLIGLILLTLVFVWAFTSLGATGWSNTLTIFGAVSVAALGIHGSVDYILHFPAVPITAAALVGAASRPARSVEERM
jgi:O-antigen ligase